ncbi:MAG TPA: lamin tail domain-containing protein [Candidatus Paceibacterota bacterium]|nr:lamin tail domain-containing protein [Candidatus Paceibacterota bacterium]
MIRDIRILLTSLGGLFWAVTAVLGQGVVINELMYRPASERSAEEYIELFNPGETAVDMAGWRLSAGVRLDFPPVTMGPGEYWVVTADREAFLAKYPGITNVIGDWSGQLANNGEKVELVNAEGEVVDSITYSNGGDWGDRLQGSSESRVIELSHRDGRATVVVIGQFRSQDAVLISGADQPEYNGKFLVSGPDFSSFHYSINGSPPSPATGFILCRQLTDSTRVGWAWSSRADGLGSSLELMNPYLSNETGQNWRSSSIPHGTPGRANSCLTHDIAPFILGVQHFPLVPRSTDTVRITARVMDEQANGLTVAVHWRIDGVHPAEFFASPMADDGASGDGEAGDGVYGARLPALAQNTVVEFYVAARDAIGHERTWPAPALDENRQPIQEANALYQVDDTVYTGFQPIYRLIMREKERAELQENPNSSTTRSSNARMNATWIGIDGSGASLRYRVGLRDRGAGTRSVQPANYNVALPPDQPWQGVDGFNLNTQYTHAQLTGYALASISGLHSAEARLVQVRVNNANRASSGSPQYGSYIQVESMDGAYAAGHFPQDPNGNLYRCQSSAHECDLDYLGDDFLDYVNAGYSKESNGGENDWTDLIRLTEVLTQATDLEYASAVRAVVDVEQWMRYFAVFTLADSKETSLANGAGDDFSLYRGLSDARFRLLAHDWDTCFNEGDSRGNARDHLFRMCPAVMGATNYNLGAKVLNRFMLHPEFVPVYYGELLRLCDTVFAPEHFNSTLNRLLGGTIPASVISRMESFNSERVAYVRSQIPLRLSFQTNLPVANGYLYATSSVVNLSGRANVLETRAIRVDGQPAEWTAWQGRWQVGNMILEPGLNALLAQAFDSSGREIDRVTVDIWCDAGSMEFAGGQITGQQRWTAGGGPYALTNSLTVADGATLEIEPGTCVFLAKDVDLTVARGGRLLAEGTGVAPIRFTRIPGSGDRWGGVIIEGGTDSPESRIAYARIEFNGSTAIHVDGGTVFLDHLTFGSTDEPYLSLDDASFVVSDCHFPSPAESFEPVHGTGGIKPGGRGVILRNFFGATSGYSDVIDFTGGKRPGPILEVINNVFLGTGDDLVDLDGTDAWIEGNIFLHVHRNESPDSASAVSGGRDGSRVSQVTVIGNLFYDCDHAATAKEGNFYTLINNTIVRQTRQGGEDSDGAVLNFTDEDTSEGAGMFLEGNIIYDAEKLTRNWSVAVVTLTNNVLSLPWSGLGGSNTVADPLFRRVPKLDETWFASWREAQVMRDWLGLRPGSPAIGRGPNGRDCGGIIPLGASISGTPVGRTRETSVRLVVGPFVVLNDWPGGSGYTHYRWRLDEGEWSLKTPVAAPLLLTNLMEGPHRVDVIGQRDSGPYQNDAALGGDAVVTTSPTWIVDFQAVPPPQQPAIRLNEILASNLTVFTNAGTTPDLVELFNFGEVPLDLSGFGITDDPRFPYKFVFPGGSSLAGGSFLVLMADNDRSASGIHLGFNLKQEGDALYLFSPAIQGGTLIDSVVFGRQLTDRSIARLSEAVWGLALPTPGLPNIALPLGDPRHLKINEWLAHAQFVPSPDFIELFNPEVLPVNLEGLWLTDNPVGDPAKHLIGPLSFIDGQGVAVFASDTQPPSGSDEFSFGLSVLQGMIGLFDARLVAIDQVVYGPQQPDISQGRSPNGADTFSFFRQPTPGAANPGLRIEITTEETPLILLTHAWNYNATGQAPATHWMTPDFPDDDWPRGASLLAHEDDDVPAPIQTVLPLTNAIGDSITTYYFRSRFLYPFPPSGAVLQAYLAVDDGAVVYLNGQEALRAGMPTGPVANDTFASRNVGNAKVEGPFALPTTSLVQGENVLAVEVHQANSNSSDITFGLSLNSVRTITNLVGQALVLNEIYAHGLEDATSDTTASDWIEVYNPTAVPLDVSGLGLSDDSTDPRKWVFPLGTVIPASSYRVMTSDGWRPGSSTNTGFNLEASGGVVFLFDSLSQGGTLLDSVRYGVQAAGFSIGRSEDQWALSLPTPGLPNQRASLGLAGELKINEWMANPETGDDWFELYNPGPNPVELSGLFLSDDLNDPTRSPLPPLSFLGVGTGAYQRFWADADTIKGPNHVGFRLSANGEAIGLFRADGYPIDQVVFGPQSIGLSEGRLPDGAAIRAVFSQPTPGQANTLIPPDADGDSMPDDWERLHRLDPGFDDAALDPDQDGLINLEEYQTGTDPQDPASVLRMETEVLGPGNVLLRFKGVAGRSYQVQIADELPTQNWRILFTLEPSATDGEVKIAAPISLWFPAQFYRVVTPARQF